MCGMTLQASGMGEHGVLDTGPHPENITTQGLPESVPVWSGGYTGRDPQTARRADREWTRAFGPGSFTADDDTIFRLEVGAGRTRWQAEAEDCSWYGVDFEVVGGVTLCRVRFAIAIGFDSPESGVGLETDQKAGSRRLLAGLLARYGPTSFSRGKTYVVIVLDLIWRDTLKICRVAGIAVDESPERGTPGIWTFHMPPAAVKVWPLPGGTESTTRGSHMSVVLSATISTRDNHDGGEVGNAVVVTTHTDTFTESVEKVAKEGLVRDGPCLSEPSEPLSHASCKANPTVQRGLERLEKEPAQDLDGHEKLVSDRIYSSG
ncbi:hypothetical protein OPT61_g4832 [Boeremia exigua]|uniref:Uncharacterized protein n=1 Tax=Boeremia exigua TaxID=749465 RepID=A0ACC2ICI3_9PLEO|nr:hypothetical protein OPT61_g4832 [Boeremia exigua]